MSLAERFGNLLRARETISLAQTADEAAILETREASPSHFLVKIESSSLNGIHKYETDEFGAGAYKWKLIIYPNKDKTGIDSDYLSIYLAISDTTSLPASWEVNAVFSFFLFNQISGNYLYSLGRARRFLSVKMEWGISKFMSKKVLKDPSNGFLIDNNCVFGAEVFMVEKPALCKCLVPKKETAPYKRVWAILNFSKLGDVWTSEQFVAGGFNWEVSLYPKGKGSDKGRYLAVFLGLIDSDRVKAWYSVSIKDQINNNHSEESDTDSFSDSEWGWYEFIDIAALKDPRNGYIVKDCCLLEIEISVLKD